MSTLNLEILPAPQRRLWHELDTTPDDFVLYGGTAIALRLGHRQSVDFDFFSTAPFDPDTLRTSIPYLQYAEVVQLSANTLTCRIDRNGPVLISFFGDLHMQFVHPAEQLNSPSLRIASLIDLAGMKIAVIQKRSEQKDYLDIHALIKKSGISLLQALAAGSIIYGKQFNPQISLKALCYFEDGDLHSLPYDVKQDLIDAIRNVTLDDLPKLREELTHSHHGS